MKQKVLLTIAFLCAVVQGAWADFDGDGSAKNPCIISSADYCHQLAVGETTSLSRTTQSEIAQPTLDPGSTSFVYDIDVEIGVPEGMTVYVTFDGNDPTPDEYESEFTETDYIYIDETKTIKAIAVDDEGNCSSIVEATYTKIEKIDIIETFFTEAGTTVLIEGTVMAAGDAGFIVDDGTDYIYVNYGSGNELTSGKVVRVIGSTSEYMGTKIIYSSDAEITDLGEETIFYPNAYVIDGSDIDFAKENNEIERGYYAFKGVLTISGDNFTIDVDDAEDTKAAIIKPFGDFSHLNGSLVNIEGYGLYVNRRCVYFIATKIEGNVLSLADDDSNAETGSKNTDLIEKTRDRVRDVLLADRTFYKDGVWNTLCLPFSLDDFDDTPLEGAVVKTLTDATFADGTLTLTFTDDDNNLTSIEAGKPYIVKWNEAAGTKVENPVFKDVKLSTDNMPVVIDDVITFTGITSSCAIDGEDKSILYLGSGNTLYYPNSSMTIGACRAYFKLADGIKAGPASAESSVRSVRSVLLNFGNEETGIETVNGYGLWVIGYGNGWYSLDGRRLDEKPEVKGLYIHNGEKVLIK